MDNELRIRKLERDLLDAEIGRMLLDLVEETLKLRERGSIPDVSPHARKIVAFVREHFVE